MEMCATDLEDFVLDKSFDMTSEQDIRFLIAQLCHSVALLHELGVIHRDLRPANFLVTERRVIVADYGLTC